MRSHIISIACSFVVHFQYLWPHSTNNLSVHVENLVVALLSGIIFSHLFQIHGTF
jgi:hypothetical protein